MGKQQPRPTELRRTCQRCQTEWFVPTEVAWARPQKQAKAAGLFTPVVGARRQQINADRALVDTHNQKLAESRRCPSCGSSSYVEVVEQVNGQTASGVAAAGWHPDPMGRHELRYWDGTTWTEHVTSGGVPGVDPL